ncbi:MAG: HEAT repeat domain-containing protein [Ilumatobacteraceae bacterium]
MSVKIGNDNDRTLDGALRALAGEPTTLTPGTAIGILAEHAVSDDDARATTKATNGLVSALTKHPDPQVRVGAATALAAVPTPAAIRALRTTVDRTDDGQVLSAAAHALASVGTRADLARITRGSTRTGWEPGERRALAAARLLSYRIGAAADPSVLRLPGEERRVLSRPTRG